MKALLKYGLCLALGLAPAWSFAQELQWRPAPNPAPAAPTAGTVVRPVSLSRPIPVAGAPGLQPIVRAQSVDEPRPLPAGPPVVTPGGLGDLKAPAPLPAGTDPAKAPTKPGEFVAPQPQPGAVPNNPPPSAVWGGAAPIDGLPPMTGQAVGACPDPCCGSGIFGGHGLFGCGSCLSNLWSGGCGPAFDPCCDPCAPCCNRPRVWVFADYLAWVPQNQSLPALVTVSPVGTPQAVTGVLGSPTTAVLFNGFNDQVRSGMRIGGGFWFTQNGNWGVDASYWFLASNSQNFTAGSNGDPNISRPFFSATDGVPASQLVAFPGLVTGSVKIHQDQWIWGFESNLRRKLCCGPNGFLDLLLGYRHFSMTENLDIRENLSVIDPTTGLVNQTRIVSDRFGTSNTFNAPQIGLAGQWNFLPRWYIGGNARVGFGVNHETVNIAGNTAFNFPGVFNSKQTGGLLTQQSNIGSYSHDRFAVMPEIGMKIGYNITPNLSVYGGYDFMYISSVVRPGNQIDLNVNRTQIPNAFGPQTLVGPAVPAPLLNAQGFWLQGFNLGLMYRF